MGRWGETVETSRMYVSRPRHKHVGNEGMTVSPGTRTQATTRDPAGIARPDWLVVVLPTVLAIRTFSSALSVLLIGVLVCVAFSRRPQGKYSVDGGPMWVLLLACGIVFSRPEHLGPLVTFLLLSLLTYRLIASVDCRRIAASLIDGCGLYLIANVAGYVVGLQSPAMNVRIGSLVESTGFVRIVFPLTWSINTPPIIAAAYIVAFLFLIRESGRLRRVLRILCFGGAVFVLIGAGTRVPIATTSVLSVAVICFPFITRWVSQAATLIAAVSAFVLPNLINSIGFAVNALSSLAPGRASAAGSVDSLNGRDYIWEKSITYWFQWINDPFNVLFGYGVNGQYRSGASFAFSDRLATLVRNPELAYVHNAFLQQFFDGGVVGWLLLVLAAFWASARLARQRAARGYLGSGAVVAMAALLLSGMTEVSFAPGPSQDTFWIFLILVGTACQRITVDQRRQM